MKITYESSRYRPELIRTRYVRFDILTRTFYFCEVGEDRRFDLRQGSVSEYELTPAIAAAARAAATVWPSYVDWPLEARA